MLCCNRRFAGVVLLIAAGSVLHAKAELAQPLSFTAPASLLRSSLPAEFGPSEKLTSIEPSPDFSLATHLDGALCLSQPEAAQGTLLPRVTIEESKSGDGAIFSTNEPGKSEWDFLWRQVPAIPITAVPEPNALALIAAAAAMLGYHKRRN